jgi:hypothetical protein
MDNEHWLHRLRSATGRAELKLPRDVWFSGDGRRLVLQLQQQAATANMQSDAAAFEAWALAFLSSKAADHVELRLSAETTSPRHYERLLYRLRTFQGLFPGQVTVESLAITDSRALAGSNLLLNQPLQERPLAQLHRAARMQKVMTPSGKGPSEGELELALEVSPALAGAFRLEKVMRQWPVGLFEGTVSQKTHVFTGGKSAIDLLGISGDTLFIFELKKGGNRKAGIISELIFYASVMRDALGDAPRFLFEYRPPAPGCAITAADIRRCSRIEAVLLAPSFHPIVSRNLLAYLNVALAERWPKVPVQFSMARLSSATADDFLISREAA